jgi:hypothetical protein
LLFQLYTNHSNNPNFILESLKLALNISGRLAQR